MAGKSKPVKIILVTGYLGAGKTTLLNHVLSNASGIRAAVIVNDIGEVNIDADLIAEGGIEQAESVVPLTNGCICCTLSDDLAEQLSRLAQSGDYDYIVIEASGICEPMPIAYTISEFCQSEGGEAAGAEEAQATAAADGLPSISLDNIVAVVDCARMLDEFEGGRRMLAGNFEEDDVEALLVEQIEFCTTVVLNKTDLVTPDQLDVVRALVRSLQKDAVIVEAENGKVPLEELLDTGRFRFDEVYRSAQWLDMLANPEHHHDPEVLEYGITTFVYVRDVPFSVESFTDFATDWPRSVIRTKGFAWVDQYPNTQFILEQAGAQRSFTDNGTFGEDQPQTKLVFIGRGMDQQAIEARLDACLAEVW